MINGSDGSIVARYEYDPYGNEILVACLEAEQNVFRFSTKLRDSETALYYYGYRYYSPKLGRWMNKDPIGEGWSKNLYHFVNNDSIFGLDLLGLRDRMSRDDYWEKWKKLFPKRDPAFDPEREDTLNRGCIGITCLILGEKGIPDFSNCYKTLDSAVKKRDEIKKNCECKGLDQEGKPASPKIFSVHLWNDTGRDGINPDLTFDTDNKADMSNWDLQERPAGSWHPRGYSGVNFDFGYYHSGPGGEGRFRHANHFHDPPHDPMVVYDSNLKEWQRSYRDFNAEVFCVTCNESEFK